MISFKDFLLEKDAYSVKDMANELGKIRGVSIMGSQKKYGRSVDFMKNRQAYSLSTSSKRSGTKGRYIINKLNTDTGELTLVSEHQSLEEAFTAVSKL